MKRIETLVEDIYKTLNEGVTVPEEASRRFGEGLSQLITERLSKDERQRKRTLRMSSLGIKCGRRKWLEINRPESIETLPPYTRMKFLYGDLIEALVLFLAELSGHHVLGEQTELEIKGVLGHRDAVIDGVLVDVKSASSYSFDKFRRGLTVAGDSFGYLDQIGSYLHASQADPDVLDKNRAGFVVVDKTLGHITLDLHKKTETDYEVLVQDNIDLVSADALPDRYYDDKPDGASGNRVLGLECSYCPVRRTCWPGLRSFAYASGIKQLTKVVRQPEVPEVNRFG